MEKNVVAISEDTNEMFAYGDVAYSMFERAPEHIRIEFPMKEGVISQFYDMQILLTRLLKPDDGLFSRGTEYVVAVPTDVTEVEKKHSTTWQSILRPRPRRSTSLNVLWPMQLDWDLILCQVQERRSSISEERRQIFLSWHPEELS